MTRMLFALMSKLLLIVSEGGHIVDAASVRAAERVSIISRSAHEARAR